MQSAARDRGTGARLCAWAMLGASVAALGCDRDDDRRQSVSPASNPPHTGTVEFIPGGPAVDRPPDEPDLSKALAATDDLCVDPNDVAEICVEKRAPRKPAGSAQARLPLAKVEAPWRELGPDLYVTDSDRELAGHIRRAIAPDNTAQAFSQVQVQVRDGVVTLRGSVDTEIERASVRERAAAVAGPRAVYDLMEMR